MKETKMTIGRVEIPLKEEEFVDANILKVTVGTNGWQEKGSKWDCRTFISLKNEACTVMKAHVDSDIMGYAEQVDLYWEGETELVTLICGLKFALDTLVQKAKETVPGFDLEKSYKIHTGEFEFDDQFPIDRTTNL